LQTYLQNKNARRTRAFLLLACSSMHRQRTPT